MKKNNKAFTLIELLAIIVILAIIAVITVPIILNIIENSRRGTVKDSAYGYKDSINKWYVSKLSSDSNYNIPDGVYEVDQLGEQVEGKKPDSDLSWFKVIKNEVTDACLQFDEYKVEIVDGKVGDTEKGICSKKPVFLKEGNITYIGDEEFYVMAINSETVTLLANTCLIDDNGTWRQVTGTEGVDSCTKKCFSDNAYWHDWSTGTLKSDYEKDINGNAADYSGNPYPYTYYIAAGSSDSNYIDDIVDDYAQTLSLHATGRLMTYEEANNLDSTVRNISKQYWLGSAYDYGIVWSVYSNGNIGYNSHSTNETWIRPVIEVSLSEL